MVTKTHFKYGLLFGAVFWYIQSLFGVHILLGNIFFSLLGSIFPDIDHHQHELAKRFPFINKLILLISDHRGITHTIYGIIFIGVLLIPVMFFEGNNAFYLSLLFPFAYFIRNTHKQSLSIFILGIFFLFFLPFALQHMLLNILWVKEFPVFLNILNSPYFTTVLGFIFIISFLLNSIRDKIFKVLGGTIFIILLFTPLLIGSYNNAGFQITLFFIVGYLSHLFADSCTISGVKFLSPVFKKKFHAVSKRMVCYTGTWNKSDLKDKLKILHNGGNPYKITMLEKNYYNYAVIGIIIVIILGLQIPQALLSIIGSNGIFEIIKNFFTIILDSVLLQEIKNEFLLIVYYFI